MQEEKLAEPVPPIDAKRYMPEVASAPSRRGRQAKAAELLRNAKHPVILAGRVSRDLDGLERTRRAGRAAERHASSPISRSAPPSRPTSAARRRARRHRAGAGSGRSHPRGRRHPQPRLGRSRRQLQGAGGNVAAKVVQVSVDHRLHNGWSMDYQGLPPVDVLIACEPDAAVPALLDALGPGGPRAVASRAKEFLKPSRRQAHRRSSRRRAAPRGRRAAGCASRICRCRGTARAGRSTIRSTISAPTAAAASAAAPAFRSAPRWRSRARGRLPVAVCGDGDFMMGVTALWTAAHYKIPLLIVVANNRSFFNDELHQERVARMRNRPVENRWVGQRISEPDIDIAAMAPRARRARLRPGDRDRRSCVRPSPRRSPRSRPARSPWSMCGSSPATPPP